MNVNLIRESFAALKPHAHEVIEHFYDELIHSLSSKQSPI